MEHFCYLCTSYADRETVLEAVKHYQFTDENDTIRLASFGAKIEDGDDYFLAQREGMINFFSGLIQPNHMEVQSNFVMQLAGCIKGYKLTCNSYEEITPLINSLIKTTSGVIFTPAMQFFTKDWKLLIDSEGNCDLDEYTVQMSAATFDSEVISTSESEDRKQNTVSQLQEMNIPVLNSLPTVPDSSQIQLRSDDELAKRIISVAVTAVKGELRTTDVSYNILEKYEIHPDDVSPWELNFLNSPEPQEQDYTNAIWRYESLNVLLWAAGYVDELEFPSDIVNVPSITTSIRDSDNFIEFSACINQRNTSEILDELDLTYRLHWACVNARINNEQLDGINPSVVYERHYALNWLVNRYGENWDDISTST